MFERARSVATIAAGLLAASSLGATAQPDELDVTGLAVPLEAAAQAAVADLEQPEAWATLLRPLEEDLRFFEEEPELEVLAEQARAALAEMGLDPVDAMSYMANASSAGEALFDVFAIHFPGAEPDLVRKFYYPLSPDYVGLLPEHNAGTEGEELAIGTKTVYRTFLGGDATHYYWVGEDVRLELRPSEGSETAPPEAVVLAFFEALDVSAAD